MPWKNGMGVTEEVASFPAGSDTGSFDWRISIAHVGADGPFSLFPGVDRTIALLDGPGLELDLPDGGSRMLGRDTAPFAFPGEWAMSSRNPGGPTIDLNVMTRRGRYTHAVQRMALAAGSNLTSSESGWAIFNTPATIDLSGRPCSLERFDAIALDAGQALAILTDAEIVHVTMKACQIGEH